MTILTALANLRRRLPSGSEFTFEVFEDRVHLYILNIPFEARGIGTEFLASVLAETDRVGLPVTLEADPTDEPNDPDTFDLAKWYYRFGFRVSSVADTGVVSLRRDVRPRQPGAEAILADYLSGKNDDLSRSVFDAWHAR